MDVMGGVELDEGNELKVVTGVDDHSRFCVAAGSGRAWLPDRAVRASVGHGGHDLRVAAVRQGARSSGESRPLACCRTCRPPSAGSSAELLIDCEEDRTLPAVLAGMLREAD